MVDCADRVRNAGQHADRSWRAVDVVAARIRPREPAHARVHGAPCIVDIDGVPCGLIICEDVWFPGPARQAREAGARLLVVANGSPYHTSGLGAGAKGRKRLCCGG